MTKFNKLTKKTVFTIEEPFAHSVSVAGEFNGWNTQTHAMKQDKKGIWKIDVPIDPGTYQFRYFVDQSRWVNDPASGEIANEHGSANSVVVVAPIEKAAKKPAAKKTVKKPAVKKDAKKTTAKTKKK